MPVVVAIAIVVVVGHSNQSTYSLDNVITDEAI